MCEMCDAAKPPLRQRRDLPPPPRPLFIEVHHRNTSLARQGSKRNICAKFKPATSPFKSKRMKLQLASSPGCQGSVPVSHRNEHLITSYRLIPRKLSFPKRTTSDSIVVSWSSFSVPPPWQIASTKGSLSLKRAKMGWPI